MQPPDSRAFYDELSDCYDLVFEDWEASMARQGVAVAALLHEYLGPAKPVRVLDAAAGIGTQALPLARQGFEVIARDLSSFATGRLVREAEARGLTVDAAQADMRTVESSVAGPVDAVIAFDNALAHLLTDAEISLAFEAFHRVLRPGGVVLFSVRDYDATPRNDAVHAYGVRYRDGVRHVPLQVWRWIDHDHYDATFHVIVDAAPAPRLRTMVARSYAVGTEKLLSLLSAAGFTDVARLDRTIYQPVFVGRRPG